jgi:endonuclease G
MPHVDRFLPKRIRFAVVLAAIALVSWPAEARKKEPDCTWKGVTESRISASDGALFPDGDARIEQAKQTHLPFGMPRQDSSNSRERLLAQEHYVIWYDPDLRVPLWTAHLLTKSDVAKSRPRADSFRSDPRLPENERSECADYSEPIFDQGHMVPNGDMGRSNTAMDNTFLMSNMTPQQCAFNRGIWQVLEKRIRDWALDVDKTWVITGVVFDRKKPVGRDPNADARRMKGKKGLRVGVPSAYYKIVVREAGGGKFDALTIMLPNDDRIHTKTQIPKQIAGHISTLDATAQRSGFRFLQSAQVSEETEFFPFKTAWAGPLSARCKKGK